jgi:hypothetical protein
MTTAKELRIWANMAKQWLVKIDNAEISEHLAQAAAKMERLAVSREVAERQLV